MGTMENQPLERRDQRGLYGNVRSSAQDRGRPFWRSPTRSLTIYEATSLNGLKDSLELMRGPHRLGENASWHAWDSGPEPAITWEDAAGSRLVKVRQRQP